MNGGIGNTLQSGDFAFIDGVHWMGMKSYDGLILLCVCVLSAIVTLLVYVKPRIARGSSSVNYSYKSYSS